MKLNFLHKRVQLKEFLYSENQSQTTFKKIFALLLTGQWWFRWFWWRGRGGVIQWGELQLGAAWRGSSELLYTARPTLQVSHPAWDQSEHRAAVTTEIHTLALLHTQPDSQAHTHKGETTISMCISLINLDVNKSNEKFIRRRLYATSS